MTDLWSSSSSLSSIFSAHFLALVVKKKETFDFSSFFFCFFFSFFSNIKKKNNKKQKKKTNKRKSFRQNFALHQYTMSANLFFQVFLGMLRREGSMRTSFSHLWEGACGFYSARAERKGFETQYKAHLTRYTFWDCKERMTKEKKSKAKERKKERSIDCSITLSIYLSIIQWMLCLFSSLFFFFTYKNSNNV